MPAGGAYVCPVDPNVRMPMIFVDDLMRGLIALQEGDEDSLHEPQRGYCIPGLSFTASELFAEIRQRHPGFGFRIELKEHMNTFANLWPDELSTGEPLRDLGYAPRVGLADMVEKVLMSHEDRNMRTALAFKEMDLDRSGKLERWEIERHIRKYLVRGREDYSRTGQNAVGAVVNKLMRELDPNFQGLVSWATFSEWNRRNTVEDFVKSSIEDLP